MVVVDGEKEVAVVVVVVVVEMVVMIVAQWLLWMGRRR